jgi:hypothetical protein
LSLKSLFHLCASCESLTAHSGLRCISCGTMRVAPRAYSAPANYGGQTDAANRRRLRLARERMERNRNQLGRVGEGS